MINKSKKIKQTLKYLIQGLETDKTIFFNVLSKNETKKLQDYISSNWKKNHIFAISTEMLYHEHLFGNELRFLVAKKDNAIIGILGFILDNSLANPDINLCMWHVSSNYPGLGALLFKKVKEFTNYRYIFSPGVNAKTAKPIYELMGNVVGKMDHFYILNNNIESYSIAKVIEKNESTLKNEKKLIEIDSFEVFSKLYIEQKYLNCKPYKDLQYLRHRYFEHPFYKYQIYEINIDDNTAKIKSFIFLRKVFVAESCVLRIIDFIGNPSDFYSVSGNLKDLVIKEKAEFIDIYSHGLSKDSMISSGFILNDENDSNIIPNYYEPFLQKKIDIYYHTSSDDILIFKGDGDQDRPSSVKVGG